MNIAVIAVIGLGIWLYQTQQRLEEQRVEFEAEYIQMAKEWETYIGYLIESIQVTNHPFGGFAPEPPLAIRQMKSWNHWLIATTANRNQVVG